NTSPAPKPGFRKGTAKMIQSSDNPRRQRKDTLRFEYRLNNSNQFTYRYSGYSWKAVDAFRGTFPIARTDWDRPNTTQIVSWMSTLRNNLGNELTYSHSLDEVYINVFTASGLYKRSRAGINYPYIFQANKEIDDKIPTISIANFSEIDGGPYPSSSTGPINLLTDTATLVTARHTLKAGVSVECSGE